MKNISRLALLSAVAAFGFSFSSAEAVITKKDVSDLEVQYRTAKEKKSPEAKTFKHQWKLGKSQFSKETAESLINGKDEKAISSFLQERKNHLEARKNKPISDNRIAKNKLPKIEANLKEVNKAISGNLSDKLEYLYFRVQDASKRVAKIEDKMKSKK